MTRSHKIGWLVLAVALLFVLWRLPRLHGQGFGSFSHDQPFLAADSKSSLVDTNPPTNGLYRYWLATDVTDGTVSSWTDRIAGIDLTATVAAHKPTKTSNYVFFYGNRLSNYNAGLNSSDCNLYFFVLSISNRVSGFHQKFFGDRTTYMPKFGVYDSSARPFYAVGSTFMQTTAEAPTNYGIFDYAVTATSLNESNYLNGAYDNRLGGNYLPLLENDLMVGNNYDAAEPFRGRIYAMLVYTNIAENNFISYITQLHNWSTNYIK